MSRAVWVAAGVLAVVLTFVLMRLARAPRADGTFLFVAASTEEAVDEIVESLRGVPEVKVTTGGSNTLATQIINGAPADVFLSADEAWAEAVAKRGLVVESVPLLTNRLVVVVPAKDGATIEEPSDLERLDKVALAGESVPAGRYAREALDHYDIELRSKVVNGHDVRAALSYVAMGEVQAGIVYATDAKTSPDVRVAFTFPEDSHTRVVYPLVLIGKTPAARALYEALRSEESVRVFERYGFARVR